MLFLPLWFLLLENSDGCIEIGVGPKEHEISSLIPACVIDKEVFVYPENLPCEKGVGCKCFRFLVK